MKKEEILKIKRKNLLFIVKKCVENLSNDIYFEREIETSLIYLLLSIRNCISHSLKSIIFNLIKYLKKSLYLGNQIYGN